MKPADPAPLPPAVRWIDPIWPLESAFATTRRILFSPFLLSRWLLLGLMAWLSQLTHFGITGLQTQASRTESKLGPIRWDVSSRFASDLVEWFEQVLSTVRDHWIWMVPLLAFLGVLALTVWVALIWLNSRGDLVFVAGVTRNETGLSSPWHEFAREANSLFRFRLVLGLLQALLMLAFAGMMLLGGLRYMTLFDIELLILLTPMGVGTLFLLLVGWLTTEFVVPIQFTHRCGCRKAWGVLGAQMIRFPTSFLLYLLVQIPLAIVTVLAVVLFAVLTCGACCLLLVPFVHVVILLPVYVLHRAYPLHFLAQFGSGWDAFATGGSQPGH